MLKGTSLPRRKNGSEAWLKENAKSLKSNTEVIGKDKEEDDCPFENHAWVSPDQIRRYTKKFNELTICVNHKRRYLGPLKFYNSLNKWKLEDLKSYTKAERKRTPAACPRAKNGTLVLLMAIKSMPSAFSRRQVLRKTWLKKSFYADHNITIHPIFLLGTEYDPFGNVKILPSKKEENYTDILQTDMKESNYALVHKDYELLKFVKNHCSNVDFIFKGDDDIFLNPDKVAEILQQMVQDKERLIHGCVKYRDVVFRSLGEKYFTPKEVYPDPFLPTYPSGAAYFMRRKLIEKILPHINETPGFFFDDVNWGVLMNRAEVGRAHAYTDSEICTQFGVRVKATVLKTLYPKEAVINPCRIQHYPVILYGDDERILKLHNLWLEYRSKPLCRKIMVNNRRGLLDKYDIQEGVSARDHS